MTFDEWTASAQRMRLEEYENASDVRDFLEDAQMPPVDEVIVFGGDRSYMAIIPKENGEAYFVVAGRFAEPVSDFDDAARHLWHEHAQYEQDDAPAAG